MNTLIENQREIARWISAQHGSLRIAVAFWGSGALEELGLGNRGDVHILLELSAGATNPREVQKLMRKFPRRVRMLDRLHAKAWIADSGVLIGSANASANGLGFEGEESDHWRELGMTSNDPKIITQSQAWFDKQWKQSRPITPADLDAAKQLWARRRAARPELNEPKGHLLDAAAASPSDFADKRIYVVVVNEDLSEAGKEELDAATERAGVQQYAYESWRKGFPLNATLVTFYDYGDGLKQDRPPVYTTARTLMKGRLQLVFPEADVLGYTVKPFGKWKARFEYFAKHHSKKWKGGNICMELNDFIAATNER